MLRTTLLALAVLASAVVGRPAVAQTTAAAAAMAQAAQSFLTSLDPAKRAKAGLPFNSEERFNWHFVPRAREGVALGQMTAAEREQALALLKSGLSTKGYAKVDAILNLEDVLAVIEGSASRDRGRYYFTVFGTPAPKGAWGWRYEGHHASFNWTVVDGQVASNTPQFLGANPADVPDGPQKGRRALAAEEDVARALVKSLRADQRAQGIASAEAPRDIVTAAAREAAMQEDRGIAYAQLTPEQQGLLLSLVQEYLSAQPAPVAQARLARIKAELGGVKFAWMGGLEKGQGHYYRIQGASFLIEYDNTQNGANHVHCVWREFKGDWGRDLLAEHYLTSPQHALAREASK